MTLTTIQIGQHADVWTTDLLTDELGRSEPLIECRICRARTTAANLTALSCRRLAPPVRPERSPDGFSHAVDTQTPF